MAFQLKDFVSIVASMTNRAKATQDKITDFNIGSVARTLMESPAIEIEEFYQRMFAGILEAIPTAIYYGFNFQLVSASASRGLVQVSFGVPIEDSFVIPAGTIFVASSTNIRYLSVQDVAVPVGVSQISVLVECSVPGSIGNAVAGAIDGTVVFDFPTNAVVSNLPLVSGQDEETAEERQARFTDYIKTLHRGTGSAVEYAAKEARVYNNDGSIVEYVTRVGSVEVPGTYDVYIYGVNQAASPELIAEAQKLVDGYYDSATSKYAPGYRPVGIRVRVFNMEELGVSAVFTVEMWPGVTLTNSLKSDILTRLSAVISGVAAGDILNVETMTNTVLATTGVKNVRCNLLENILCPTKTALIPGDIQIVAGDA
jgi:hypothetical protein